MNYIVVKRKSMTHIFHYSINNKIIYVNCLITLTLLYLCALQTKARKHVGTETTK